MNQEERLRRITQCCDEMEWTRRMQNEHRVLIAVVGELDWHEELRSLLYDDATDPGKRQEA